MSANNKIKNFSTVDIEKYHKGLLSPKERHDLEKAALDDPFLADALEGYAYAGSNISEDVVELNKRLSEKTGEAKVIPFSWWRVAAVIILISGAGFLVYQFAFNKKPNEIAESKPAEINKTVSPDSFQNSVAQKKEDNAEMKERKAETKNQTRVSVTNETFGSGMSKTKWDSAITQSLNTQPLSISPSKDIVAKQNYKTEELSKEGIAKKEMNAQVLKDKNSLSETVVVQKAPDKNAEVLDEGSAKNKNSSFQKAKSLDNNFFKNATHNNVFRGRITDANNNPLPFANITNIEDSVGTYADAKGYFTLTSPDSVLDVRVQSLGFINAVTKLHSDALTNKVILNEDTNLDAIVLSKKKPNTTHFAESNLKLQESEPADGWDNYDTYLANNLQIPETIKMKQNRGEVEVSFDVNENGEPINFKVEKSLCTKCDKEAIRLIKDGPKWVRHSNGRVKITVSF